MSVAPPARRATFLQPEAEGHVNFTIVARLAAAASTHSNFARADRRTRELNWDLFASSRPPASRQRLFLFRPGCAQAYQP
jgi:hypothetical protein